MGGTTWRTAVFALLALALLTPAACTPDSQVPDHEDSSDGERLPDSPEPERTPSPSTSEEPTEQEPGDGDSYEDIDLEDGDDISEGNCGSYDPPETAEEFRAVKKCNPDHEYGVCPMNSEPMGGGEVIVGSSGDDVLEGTSKDSYICGMGGNDIIIGGTGKNSLWGGPGNDYIEGGKHSDRIGGGDHDDIIKGNNSCIPAQGKKCGADYLYGEEITGTTKDAGDDAIYGGVLSITESIEGGPGNDIIVPTVAGVYGADITAGDGNDFVATLDFSYGFVTADTVNLGARDGKVKLGMPLGKTCEVTAELNLNDPKQSDEGKVTCHLPWPGKWSKLGELVDLRASIDQEGEVKMEGELYNKFAKLSVSETRKMTDFQATMRGDVCVCDPLKNPAPTEPMPYDWDATTDNPKKKSN